MSWLKVVAINDVASHKSCSTTQNVVGLQFLSFTFESLAVEKFQPLRGTLLQPCYFYPNTAVFATGVVAGSAVTLAATGSDVGLVAGAGAGMAAIVDTAAAAAPFAAAAVPLATAAAPVVVPVAVVGAVAGGAYLVRHQTSEAPASK